MMATTAYYNIQNRWLLLRCLLVIAGVLVSNIAHAQTKQVFAHYMVCFTPYSGTVDGYKRDIQDAQRVGIDGFALNCGDWNTQYKQNTANMFEAARQLNTNFKLFFSADQTGGLWYEWVLDMVKTYAKHPNYFNYKGRPFLSAWTGGRKEYKNEWLSLAINPLKKAGYNVYFIPFMFPTPVTATPDYALVLKNYSLWWSGFLDGYYFFGAGGLPDYDSKNPMLRAAEAYAKVFHDSTKTFMSSVIPQYWGAKQGKGRRYFDLKGGEGLAKQWQSVIEIQKPEWMELVTWNDWDEFSYFSPMDDINKYNPYTEYKQPGFHHTHKGFAELNKYYIQWYKKGKKPAIKNDNLYFFYRTYPKDMVAVNDPQGPVTERFGDIQDEIYVTTILKNPATLSVISGGVKAQFSVGKGIVHTRIPFHSGAQSFELSRGDHTLLSAEGEPILEKSRLYDFDMYSGYAAN